MLYKNIIKTTALYLGVFIMSLLVGYLAFAWTEPGDLPPADNVDAPLNIGTDDQAKSGSLGVNAVGRDVGFVVDDGGSATKGFVGIGTWTPGYKLDVAGQANAAELCIAGVCQSSWPSGGDLPAGSSGQTLRHDGTSWVANSVIYNDGTNVGIGTTPYVNRRLNVEGLLRTDEFELEGKLTNPSVVYPGSMWYRTDLHRLMQSPDGVSTFPIEFLPVKYFTTGTDILWRNDNTKGVSSTSYTKAKEMTLYRTPGSTLKISFDLQAIAGSTAYARIYRNDVAVGTERVTIEAWVTYEETIAGWNDGDLLQLYVRTSDSAKPASVANFRITGSVRSIENSLE
jgi:hypothetical protein